MNIKYLPLIPLLVFNSAYAQTTLAPSTTTYPVETFVQGNSQQDNNLAEQNGDDPILSLPAPYRSSEGGRLSTLFGQVEFGYVISKSKKDTINGSGGGLVGKIEYGWRHLMPTRYASRYNFIALSLFYAGFTLKERYNLAGTDFTTKYRFGVVGLPVSYSSINNNRNVGYYWQIGTNFNYIASLKLDKTPMLKGFSKVYVEPMVSAGISIRYEYKGHDMCGLIGAYAGYSVTNFTTEKDAGMQLLTVGIRYTSIRF